MFLTILLNLSADWIGLPEKLWPNFNKSYDELLVQTVLRQVAVQTTGNILSMTAVCVCKTVLAAETGLAPHQFVMV